MPSTPEPHEQWYVLHVLSGQENSVRDRIIRKAKDAELSDFIYRVEVPTELISEVRNGKKTERHSKLFPGYVYANMYLLEADGTLNKDLWYFIQQIDGVISIAGSRNAPLPMRKREVEDLLPLLDAEAVAARPKVEFAVGDHVRVKARSRARKAPSKKSTRKRASCVSASPFLAVPRLWTWNTGRWKKPESSLRLPPSAPFPFIFSANKAKPWQKK